MHVSQVVACLSYPLSGTSLFSALILFPLLSLSPLHSVFLRSLSDLFPFARFLAPHCCPLMSPLVNIVMLLLPLFLPIAIRISPALPVLPWVVLPHRRI